MPKPQKTHPAPGGPQHQGTTVISSSKSAKENILSDTSKEYKGYCCHPIKIHNCKTCQGIPVPPDASGSFKGCRYCHSVREDSIAERFVNFII
jgi:hypothetical protein